MFPKELENILGIKLSIEPIKECWFIFGRDWSNYCTVKGEKAHRLVFKLFRGPLIKGKEICHFCDRKGCINPDHLFQGTHKENMKDALNKGRLVQIKLETKEMRKLKEIDNWKQLKRFT